MNWRTIVGGVLLVVALLSGWSLWKNREGTADDNLAGGRADYVLVDFELVALDETGREAFTLRAPRLTRDPHAKTMDIATPLFVIPPKAGTAGTPWEVRSRTGWVAAKGEELRLRGQVRATSTNERGQPLLLASEQLNVFPKTKRASSAVAVALTQPGFILNGRGMEADLNTKLVHINNAKGRYERTSR